MIWGGGGKSENELIFSYRRFQAPSDRGVIDSRPIAYHFLVAPLVIINDRPLMVACVLNVCMFKVLLIKQDWYILLILFARQTVCFGPFITSPNVE